MSEVPKSLLAERVSEFVAGVDALYISTEHVPVLRETIKVASRADIPVVSNINTPLLTDPIADHDHAILCSLIDISHTLIMNEAEARQVFVRLSLTSWASIKSSRLEEVIITGGGRGGSMSAKPFKIWEGYEATTPTDVKCIVGAGDTFNGAYLKARFIDGLSLSSSCNYASQVAGKKVGLRSSALQDW